MTDLGYPGDREAPDGDATRSLADAMRSLSMWTLRSMVAFLFLALMLLIIAGLVDAF